MSVKCVYVVTEKAFWHLNAVRRKSLAGYLLQWEMSLEAIEEVVLALLAVLRVSAVTAHNLDEFDKSSQAGRCSEATPCKYAYAYSGRGAVYILQK